MNSKKAITLLVLVTMLMALVPIVPVNAAIDMTDIEIEGAGANFGDAVQKGDEITVIGSGVTSGATVNIYWDIVQETFTNGEGKVATGKAKASGTFEIDFDVPAAVNGSHYLWVKDVSTGQTVGGTDYDVTVIPKLSISPSSGLIGDTITLSGYGYGYDADDIPEITVYTNFSTAYTAATTSPTTVKTNSVGSWTATIKVPTAAVTANIWAKEKDYVANNANKTFTVGPVITLDKTEGPSGTVLTISGRGFGTSSNVTVTIEGVDCYIISGSKTRSDGRLTTKVVIPSMPLDADDEPVEYTVEVSDLTAKSATETFEVNGVAKVKTTPTYGPQGTQVTVEGWNFTKIVGTEIEVMLNNQGAKVFKTDANGYFKGLYTIPALPSETYTINGTNADHNITAEAELRVGVMLVILTPNSGASGAEISVTAIGFETGEAYTVYIGDEEWFADVVEAGGTIGESRMLPTIAAGTYTVRIVEDESEIEVTASLTVTETTKLKLTPGVAPNDYNVTVEGWNFANNPGAGNKDLEFVLYNATQEWLINPISAVELGDDDDWDEGYFEAKFTVPDSDSISVGAYTLNVTDGEGMFAQVAFNVVEKTQSISPRKSVFVIGDTVSFNVETSFKVLDSYIKINSPSGDLYWLTEAFGTNVWTTVGTVNRVPYYYQTAGANPMVLLTDAPIGTYTWKYYDADDELLDSGSFTVNAAPTDVIAGQVTDLANQITDLADQLDDVTGEFASVKSSITNVAALAQQAVTAAQQAAQAVQTVATTANQANTAAQAAATAANAARDAANGLTTLVYGAIGAALVAALAAIVSLMQISRRIAG